LSRGTANQLFSLIISVYRSLSTFCQQIADNLGTDIKQFAASRQYGVAGQLYGDSPAMNTILPNFGKFSQDLTKFNQVSAPTFEAIRGAV